MSSETSPLHRVRNTRGTGSGRRVLICPSGTHCSATRFIRGHRPAHERPEQLRLPDELLLFFNLIWAVQSSLQK
jgi:hypothetical protein